jgi:hypothetical protein
MAANRRILCVDDHSDTCELIAVILKDFEVVSPIAKAKHYLKPPTVSSIVLVELLLAGRNRLKAFLITS